MSRDGLRLFLGLDDSEAPAPEAEAALVDVMEAVLAVLLVGGGVFADCGEDATGEGAALDEAVAALLEVVR